MTLSIFLGMIGPWQIVLILAIVLLLFGGRKIPELMKGLGGGLKEFKKAVKEEDDDENDSAEKKA
ncbi:MAG: twin-arginine translocase TatA/TatE family subunit [Schleiferiaceae bacterium]|jgi:sec-independent protein translocase protein TatA|nr:twin-arginine translocase TatA/TatE family subunit [Schleiferiaceae bacterium]MDG1881584.1 twin-arginine translocase TatA/TatE family subunit [Schleiferiaceae bacterium]|tara:strand:+ start:7746 stop:7940 length:195 start_codon:yes stop_codon:yes gene_type:complete